MSKKLKRFFLKALLIISAIVVLIVFYRMWQVPDILSGPIPSVLDGGVKPRQYPNIILITVDTLRADHLGCYGYTKNTSPNIDRFASDAALFKHCFAHAPLTGPSCACILSGFLPHETKVFENIRLPNELETLPEILQQVGYTTVGVVSNYVLRGHGGKSWSQGFNVFDDKMDDFELVRDSPERTADNTTDRAVQLLKENHNDRLFLWVHYQDPHGPYTPPTDFGKQFSDSDQNPRILKFNKSSDGKAGIPDYQKLGKKRDFYHYLSQYDGEIRYLDEHFDRLIQALKETGLYDKALIIFSADHGENLGERNIYFCHGRRLYNTLLHVPLIIKYGTQLTGIRKDFVQHLDIVPTVLNALGIRPDERFRGRDLSGPGQPQTQIFAEIKHSKHKEIVGSSVIVDGLKLIKSGRWTRYELFDLKNDFNEEHDLIKNSVYRQKVKELKKILKKTQEQDYLRLSITNDTPELTEDERRKLESLGYI
jgi:arylsulfatase